MAVPKGKLIIIGGSEHKGDQTQANDKQKINPEFVEMEILKKILEECKDCEGDIEVITTASASHSQELGKNYIEAFHKLKTTVGVLDIRHREEAHDEKFIERVSKAKSVLFTGGDQLRLSSILGGTPCLNLIYEKYLKEDFVVAGTSAGAMVMSNSMIFQGKSEDAFFKGELKITSGFGFIPGIIIDTHFVKRGRFGRLAQAVAINPSYIGLGLEEDTAVCIAKGTQMETIGSGNVIIIDGHHVRNSNIYSADRGTPISINNLKVHIMAKGDKYNIHSRKMTPLQHI